MIREAVTIEPRRSMTAARKRRIHKRENGICWLCSKPVPMFGPDVRYDHKKPLELGGPDDDANVFPLHTDPCDKLKTSADRKRIDKAKRQNRKAYAPREPSRLRGRPFPTDLRKKFNGTVVRRATSSNQKDQRR